MGMTENSVLGLAPSGFHRIAYTDWGDTGNERVLICVHGLTRNGRDFDTLADQLQTRYRVICPDIPGRGNSDWLSDPAEYINEIYVNDMMALIARTGTERVDWIGTSMGGIIGMAMAASTGSPIRKMVINDIGPLIPDEALQQINDYVGVAPEFTSTEEANAYIRALHAGFGPLTDDQWAHMTRFGVRDLENGTQTLHYDPAIGQAFAAFAEQDIEFWDIWEKITCPVLVLRGEHSQLLSQDTADRMANSSPDNALAIVPDCAHAPGLMDDATIALIHDWLNS